MIEENWLDELLHETGHIADDGFGDQLERRIAELPARTPLSMRARTLMVLGSTLVGVGAVFVAVPGLREGLTEVAPALLDPAQMTAAAAATLSALAVTVWGVLAPQD